MEKTNKKISKAAPKTPAKKTPPSGTKPAVKKAPVPAKPKSEVFAVIQTGGKQYIVRPGETLKVEKITPPEKGDSITFEEVLLVFDPAKDGAGGKEVKIGEPFVKGAKVTAKIEGDVRGKKINVIRYKSKTRQFKKKGHRQTHTKITITEIK